MPSSRLPTTNDFPSALKPVLHPASPPTNTISNIMLFLPGLGDTSPNFANFPQALNLPETQTITLQPPFPLPFGLTSTPSHHWSDDLSISTSTGELDGTESGFMRATKLLVEDVIVDVLVTKCGFRYDEIHLFGFGQGASLALSVVLDEVLRGKGLGGVVSIGGPLPLGTPAARVGAKKRATPVLVLGGVKGVLFGGGDAGDSRVKRLGDRFEFVEVERWRKGDDGMPRNREEVLPLMRFWGRRLRSRRGVPDDAVEIG